MSKARARLQSSQLARDDAGLSTVEYLIILVLVAAIAMGAWQTFGNTNSSDLSNASSDVSSFNVSNADSSQTGSKR